MKHFIKELLKKTELVPKDELRWGVDYPREHSHGHYATNVALMAANGKKANPREIAELILNKLAEDPDFNTRFEGEIAGPGFINFRLKPVSVNPILRDLISRGDSFGVSKMLQNKRVMVEYAQPNPFKSFHIGHLRNVVIGESLARSLENAGAEVIRTNYQGDVGLHVAKCFYGMKRNPFNDTGDINDRVNYLAACYVAGARAFKDSEEAKAEIRQLNRDIYGMSPIVKEEWSQKRKWSLDKFEKIFQRVGSRFNRYYFESEMHEEGLKRCAEAKVRGVLIEDDNCLVFKGEDYGLNRRVFVNKQGLPTYEGKELGLAYREISDFGKLDKIIHVVANEQINFFAVTFMVEKLLDQELFDDKQYHLPYGLIKLKGGKISSRVGNVILGEDVIDTAKEEIRKVLEKRDEFSNEEKERVAERVALGAVKYSLLKAGTMKDMVFDLEESIRTDGQSGPYIQYSYVRAENILKKIGDTTANTNDVPPEINADLITEHEINLIYEILKFEEVAEEVARHYQLSLLADYTYRLANSFAIFYNNCRVADEEREDLKAFRVRLVGLFRHVLGRCLDLMGIPRLEKM